MYAAIAPKWWRVLVAIISVKTLRPPKIGQGLEGPQIDDLEPQVGVDSEVVVQMS